MNVRVLTDANEFAELANPWLASDPFSTNVIGVHLDGVLNGVRAAGADDIWLTAIDEGHLVGGAMHTPPHSLFLPRLPAGVASEIALELSWDRSQVAWGQW